jgi:nucleotide-binding universal stress UspA family protein
MQICHEIVNEELAHSQENMARLIHSETMRGWQAEAIIEVGNPAEVILSAALTKRADLIVMGAHHASGSATASHIPWATASSVACGAPCPVLTVGS